MLIKHFLEENANFVYPQCIFKEAETQWGGNRLKSLWTTVGGWG